LGLGKVLTGPGLVSGNVSDAGTVGGSLTVNGNLTVTNGGTVSPGPFVNTVTVNGNLTFQPGGTFAADIAGPGFADQIAVNGSVNLGATGDILNPVFGYVPSPGDLFNLIVNDGTDPLSGPLTGARNRPGENPNGTFFQVRYDGGTGNDLELVANTSPVLDPNIDPRLTPILEDTPPASNPGTSVDALVATG